VNTQETPQETILDPSINRPHLLLGGDRELVICAGLGAAAVAFTLMTWWGFIIALGIWLVAIAILGRMAKADALLRHVYRRYIRYGVYYSAKSGPFARQPTLPKNWRSHS
jgi:type IV secretory pathway TrbD component